MWGVVPMQRVIVFGGTGFVGRHIVNALLACQEPYEIHVISRHGDPQHLFQKKGVIFHQASILTPATFEHLLTPESVVINTVGILFPTSHQSFEQIHHHAVASLARIAQTKKVAAFIHLSALGADKDSLSLYASSKAAGEKALQEGFPNATILRPSVIFGEGDQFLNRFSQMAAYSPFLPLIGGGKTKFQPVYVKDIALAVVSILKNKTLQGKVYELGGDDVLDFKEILEMLLKHEHRNRFLISIPFSFARWLGKVGEYLPTPPITQDQVELLKKDNCCSQNALTFKDLEILPLSLKDYLEKTKR